jgi:hypothetical protein
MRITFTLIKDRFRAQRLRSALLSDNLAIMAIGARRLSQEMVTYVSRRRGDAAGRVFLLPQRPV